MLATQAKRDYYQVLSVNRTATDQEIKAAFDRLTADFHAAGRPKNIDDVEWLRTVARAYRTLSNHDLRKHYDLTGDDTAIPPARPAGYDAELLEKWERQIDLQTKSRRNAMFEHFLIGF